MRYTQKLLFILCAVIIAANSGMDVWAEVPYYSRECVFSSHINEENKIALTFDDGPHPVYTPLILDILKEYGVQATFFVIGENAERYPDLIRRILAEGHEIGNHTYLHKNLKEHTMDCVCHEIVQTEETILRISEQRTKILRPPGGLYDTHVCDAAEILDYDIILWTLDTLDWKHPTPDEIVKNISTNIKSGDIILCHDFIGGAPSPTPEAMRKVIPLLLDKGYCFVSVSSLIHSTPGESVNKDLS